MFRGLNFLHRDDFTSPLPKGMYLELFPGVVMGLCRSSYTHGTMFPFGQRQAFEGWLLRDRDAGHGQREE